MEEKNKWQWSLFIIVPLIVIGVFIWQLDNFEKFFKQYPNTIDGGTLLFVLVTTTLISSDLSALILESDYKDIRGRKQTEYLLKLLITSY